MNEYKVVYHTPKKSSVTVYGQSEWHALHIVKNLEPHTTWYIYKIAPPTSRDTSVQWTLYAYRKY